ncbi:MAG: Mov34/MPN/PAD-1 family protein [Alphaproteobacteria bacterium]
MMIFCSDQLRQKVVFTNRVVKLFKKHQQTNAKSKEAGGQLFASFEKDSVIIMDASEPNRQDIRGKYFFHPNRDRERQDINIFFKKGLHYVGDWHTHFEPAPNPSDKDKETIRDCFIKSDHKLDNFILVVVGTACFPEGLSVSIHNDKTYLFLHNV